MFNVIRLIDTVDDAACDRLIYELRSAASTSGAKRALIQPTLPGTRNGGDILMHLQFDGVAQWNSAAGAFETILADPAVDHVNGATYTGNLVTASPDRGSIYRTLLLRVQPGSDEAILRRFEDDLRLLPRYVTSICTWQLSRVDSAVGTSPWTHVFEQEFRDVEGLMGPYLMHPIHWAYVDRWFDPECPECIVRDRVCHSFCRAETP
ncbi:MULTISPECIES: Dabb family protein [unclassified Mycobacterium]|uniref:Dabb family protein n=1 Tax=unclassified Mycobacterium TaxID=2642494 RepID=UPI00073FD500|nr:MULTISPECIES: Dabb family protein [unclassified Mycobacterium]KUH81160.1 stress responsive protein [Mycobacterium sp. GA-1999]KUH84160.1 stress responsive protein [Mycobacterium sp. IS-1556]KUH90034.1 stress responsive protein [Mycobacterium sp. GA-0227b]